MPVDEDLTGSTVEQMGDATMSVLRVREVFRWAGWPERFVASVPDVTVGEFTRRLEDANPGWRNEPLPLPPQWSAWPMSKSERAQMADPAANARAAMRYFRERYSVVSGAWETWGRRWPSSPPPSSPHGDPMASLISRR